MVVEPSQLMCGEEIHPPPKTSRVSIHEKTSFRLDLENKVVPKTPFRGYGLISFPISAVNQIVFKRHGNIIWDTKTYLFDQ